MTFLLWYAQSGCTPREFSHCFCTYALYSEFQCIMGNGHMGILPPPTNEQADACKNITFLKLHLIKVNNGNAFENLF